MIPTVYFTKDISAEGIIKAYNALGWEPTGKLAVKLHSGESEKSNYLRPYLIKPIIQSLNGTIVECNVGYGGPRAESHSHHQLCKDHGLETIAKVDIMDENGEIAIPVKNGKWISENYVGASFKDYDSYLVLSHFKGHLMGGFGGAVKNISIGLASSSGKVWIHTSGKARKGSILGDQDSFLETMAEAAKSVMDYLGSRIAFVNVMNRLSIDCDCDGNPHEPDMADIGVLSSLDPVALDQACVDLIYAAPDGASVIKRMEEKHGIHTLERGEEIGLGSRKYNLVSID